MKKSLAWNAVVGALLLFFSACATPTRTRYEVASNSQNESRISTEDREAVKEAFAAVAPRLKLQDFTSSSLVPETIAFYQQADKQNPLKLLSWVENDRILIEIMQFPPRPGESLLYQQARELLQGELRSRFGERSAIISFRELERSTPPETR